MRLWEVIDKHGNNYQSMENLCKKGENDGGMGKYYFLHGNFYDIIFMVYFYTFVGSVISSPSTIISVLVDYSKC